MNNGMQRTISLPQLTFINKWIIIVSSVSFVLNTVLKQSGVFFIEFYGGLSAKNFFEGHLYEIVTYPFVSNQGLMVFIFNAIILWFIGSPLESSWGSKRYLGFISTAYIGGGILYAIISALFFSGPSLIIPLTELIGIANALLLAYAILYPNQIFYFMFIFPLRAKYFCMLLVGIQLYIGFLTPHGNLAWGHLGTMFFGFIYMLMVSTKIMDTITNIIKAKNKKQRKSKFTLIKGDDDTKPKYWQ